MFSRLRDSKRLTLRHKGKSVLVKCMAERCRQCSLLVDGRTVVVKPSRFLDLIKINGDEANVLRCQLQKRNRDWYGEIRTGWYQENRASMYD